MTQISSGIERSENRMRNKHKILAEGIAETRAEHKDQNSRIYQAQVGIARGEWDCVGLCCSGLLVSVP
jgi:hypothetical protein